MWSRTCRYPGLTTQSPAAQYSLSDFPMPVPDGGWAVTTAGDGGPDSAEHVGALVVANGIFCEPGAALPGRGRVHRGRRAGDGRHRTARRGAGPGQAGAGRRLRQVGLRGNRLNSIGSVSVRQFGLKQLGLVPPGQMEDIVRGAIGLATEGFFEGVAAGRITVHGNRTIARLLSEDGLPAAELDDGTRLPADLVVCA
ncbi:MAG TPA: hypothetical protein VGD91_10430, partial [Trebonia sp.]